MATSDVVYSKRPDAIIQTAVKAVIGRPARPEEINLLKKLYSEEVLSFKSEPKRAASLLQVGEYKAITSIKPVEWAAWTVVVSTIMNMDEAIVKR